jgi:hypothetical protein
MEQSYTPEKANRMLSEVREIVTRIVDLKQELDLTSSSKRRAECIDELGRLMSRLEERGIELKDIDNGLIDFPATRFGSKVYLCWKLGEAEVMYWHDLQSGFKGRRSLKPEAMHAR